MSTKKLGFIGCGNMASAIMGGILKQGLMEASDIIGADVFAPSREKVKAELGIVIAENNKEVVEQAEVFVLSVKPQFYAEVIAEIKDSVRDGQVIITLAPGKTLAWLEEQFGKAVKLVRTMPNTPAMVLEGMTAACPNQYVTEEELTYACEILRSFGDVEVVPEKMIDAVVAVSGSSPAYVYMLIEAMADAAVAEGMPRDKAIKFAAKAVLGSAKMVLETGRHPGELKDMVCSPGGTTIEAVKVLEETGFRGSIMQAMEVCAEKSRSL
ncbi:MAG: pyrroline-5-carboxylate reductase [Faecalimonas sp.]|nr:pyrroline-5-carboxylate reductase [Faecalimonas sp.]